MGAELGADAGQEHRELERLGHVVIRPGLKAQDGVGVRVVARQHQDRALDALLAHDAGELAPVGVGEAHVEDHEVEEPRLGLGERVLAGGGLEHVEILGHHELLGQGLAQVVVVVHQENLLELRHRVLRCGQCRSTT